MLFPQGRQRVGSLPARLALLAILAGGPSGYAIAQSSNLDHPRLFFDAGEIEHIRARAATTHSEIWQPIRDYTDAQLVSNPPPDSPTDGTLTTYRNFGNMLIPFALTAVITGRPEHRSLVKKYLLAYASWEQWDENGYRDLGHAHLLLASALAYDWLHENLSPSERNIVRSSLASRAQEMYEASSGPRELAWGNWWRNSYLQNHYWTNNCALGMAGLALLGEDARAEMWVEQAADRMSLVQDFLTGIGDGSWHEGIHYQSYGLTLALPFWVNLRRLKGTDLIPHGYLRNFPAWRIYNHLPNSIENILGYGDVRASWGNGYQPQNILRFAAREYNDGYAQWMARRLAEADTRRANIWSAPWFVFEFLYFDASVQPKSPDDLETSAWFPDIDAVIWRTGWDSEALVFGLKSGAHGGRFAFDSFVNETYPWESPCSDSGCQLNIGHDHDDTNGFYLYRAGQWLAPESQGSGRIATAFHNTLLIDGQGQFRPEGRWRDPTDFPGSDGFITKTANAPGFDYVEADATGRYKQIEGIERVSRQVIFVRPAYFVVVDELRADVAHDYSWVCHFDGPISVESGWVKGHSGNSQVLGVGMLAPDGATARLGEDKRPYVHINSSSGSGDTRLVNVLYPATDASWSTRPNIEMLAENEMAIVMRLDDSRNQSTTDDIIFNDGQPGTLTTVGSYIFDGRVSVVRLAGSSVQQLFVFGGTSLTDAENNRDLVANLSPGQWLEAVFEADDASLYGEVTTPVRLYAPATSRLFVNGRPASFVRSGDHIVLREDTVSPLAPTGVKATQD